MRRVHLVLRTVSKNQRGRGLHLTFKEIIHRPYCGEGSTHWQSKDVSVFKNLHQAGTQYALQER